MSKNKIFISLWEWFNWNKFPHFSITEENSILFCASQKYPKLEICLEVVQRCFLNESGGKGGGVRDAFTCTFVSARASPRAHVVRLSNIACKVSKTFK